ncbi:hypothetical protein MADA3029_450005 [Vibrio nigripulchritudo MADA3029]|uniref:hypothetical protein n=1 Tax=Vibrio nigripulchritudo TaxID=28173 RepID=UPI0003B1ADC8|nr:hypothetical protein [Vibrio nigripulchritudo]CCN46042.1 hypothetical protein VIBNIMADA3020_1190022 [Vibrio nigripulchritudo MADA3020]CCN54306.1 hypothetical protein VIBNIMADA3021_530005 [Vibrio nigripulchritudo MADA3021]CCN59607.1 hypothetical protein MADA3029_450005 [Vibrio nigripulchritudo MADA3029]
MGQGAYVKVTDNTSNKIRVYVENQQCMYSNGEEGSHLEQLDNLTVLPDHTFPSNGKGIYVEDKGSGGCFFSDSYYTLKFVDVETQRDIGSFRVVNNSHIKNNTNEHRLHVNINTHSKQSHIAITVRPE